MLPLLKKGRPGQNYRRKITLMDIAAETGFSGGNYYAEAFRKWTWKSPAAYRRASME